VSEDFTGKVALVTGAAGGMGRATALAFAAAGARVVAVDIADDEGNQTVELIRAAGGEALFAHTDVSVAADVEAAVTQAVETYGGLDCAANMAAIETETGPLADCDESVFDRLVAVNLKSIFLCCKYEIRAMLSRGSGAIVNIASTNSFRPQPNQPTYTATKHGVVGMTKAAAIDYAKHGIRINAVAPGAIDTPMLRHAMEVRARKEADVVDRLSLVGRLGEPEEIANGVLWLCSDRSTYTIGHVLAVDGGYLAR
jgi:NAD(P)-dependent dehydrogenase (short-subunit alcohol dehydrogenase family)